MSYTFLNAVNLTLKGVRVLSDNANLESFTDSQIQIDIDRAVRLWNEAIQEMYNVAGGEPKVSKEHSLTLAERREYTLPENLETINWPLIDETNGFVIYRYNGDYAQMRIDQRQPSQFTGQPHWAAINPTNGKLRMNTTPSSSDVGNVYKLFYDARISFSKTTDIFPFSDSVTDALVAVVMELWRLENNQDSSGKGPVSFARAIRLLTKAPRRKRW